MQAMQAKQYSLLNILLMQEARATEITKIHNCGEYKHSNVTPSKVCSNPIHLFMHYYIVKQCIIKIWG